MIGGFEIPVRALALAWAGAIAIFGALSTLIVLTADAESLVGESVATKLKVVGIAMSLIILGFAGLAGFGLLGRGDRETLLGVAVLGLTLLAALFTTISILSESTIPGDRLLGVLWILALFGGLLGVAIRLVEGEQIERAAGYTGAAAAVIGGGLGSIITLIDSPSDTAGRVVGACTILAVAAVLVGFVARHAET